MASILERWALLRRTRAISRKLSEVRLACPCLLLRRHAHFNAFHHECIEVVVPLSEALLGQPPSTSLRLLWSVWQSERPFSLLHGDYADSLVRLQQVSRFIT